jgi:hypothetical protein
VNGFVRDEVHEVDWELAEEHLREVSATESGRDERLTLIKLARTLTSVQPSYSPWLIWSLVL